MYIPMWLAVLLLLLVAVVAWPVALLVVAILALWFYPWVVLSLLAESDFIGSVPRFIFTGEPGSTRTNVLKNVLERG